MERELLTYPIWERYTVLSKVIGNMTIRDRRNLFHTMRSLPVSPEAFFPSMGFTVAEFAVWHILGDAKREEKRTKKAAPSAPE